jgi:tetratricopeptide (TPR) repeat protein
MSAQPQPEESQGVQPTPPPDKEEAVTDPRALKLNEIKQSFEKGSYNETVKLADSFLAENPDDTTALDYKNKAETQNLINTTLQTGISHYKNRRYSQCKREMEKIFKLEKNHKDARKYWNLSDRAIFEAGAKKEILSIVETIKKAEENKELEVFDYYIGSPALKDLKIPDLRWIFNNFNSIQSEVDNSGISIDFKDRTHAEVKFFNFSSAVSKQTGQRERIFEGDIIWTMEKQGDIWRIIKEEKRER